MLSNMDDRQPFAAALRNKPSTSFRVIRTSHFSSIYLTHSSMARVSSPKFMQKAQTVEEAQIEEVDWSVGQILDTLRNEGLDHNTLVLFTSDNGPAGGLSAGPLRGRKGSAFEGGHREPTIAWWPGTIRPILQATRLSRRSTYTRHLQI